MAPASITLGALTTSPIGFGCMGMTAFYGPPMKNADGVALLQAVHAAGCSHFDTAEVYRQFGEVVEGTFPTNEELVGAYLRTVPRDSFTVATKYAPWMHEQRFDYEAVSSSLDGSLARLGVDAVDLYYCHRMPATVELLEEWMHAAKRLVESGRVKHVGLSEVPPQWLRRAHAIHPVAAVQQEWSLLTRGLEAELLPTCRELGVGIVAYSPLARNLLAKTAEAPPEDWRANHPRFGDLANFKANQELAAKVAALAEGKGCTGAQISLAWLTHKAAALGVSAIAIPGTTKAANALSNIASLDVSLSEEDMATLEALGALVAGARGNEEYLASGIEGKSAA
ncbi:hypothetical protein AB1Y20_016454 [Prymnesium parvum]|uniref:NADP-dependent oxidoreductase domain-containing protein n=1 Tax=Prymnesium parvum TaxID=97485 RepID=A0AB34IE80_PRYPA|mmetsp:Transcript_30743/g.76758  ORF Transcript_30743/g.76758 Transcript_30743/m.76758 type:complete len:339 (-) Transcript_30743:320-1336(-)